VQESRLFRIIYYLLDKGPATASELAEKLEVSVRTIYRDMDALSEAGIPIYTETGRNGGIRLMDHFILDRALLSKEEKQELLASLQVLGATGIESINTLHKLAALFGVNAENWLEVDFSRWSSSQKDNEKFESLKEAVIRHKCVKVTYAGSQGERIGRVIWPLKLSYKAKAWYLKAYCTERENFRLFKLSRILGWEILDEEFAPCMYPDEEDIPEKNYPLIVLRFPVEMSYRVYDEFDSEDVKWTKEGDLLVSSRMPEDAWLVSFLLSFGEKVEVIEPVRLKKELAEMAKAIYEKNKP